jgi:Protein of unknown function (DUF3574)
MPAMRLALLMSLLLAGACPANAASSCAAGLEPRSQVELYFGRNIGEVVGVSEDAWATFLDEEITPRFPDGLSVIDIRGQWKDMGSGRIVREPGKLLVLIVTASEATRRKIADIVTLYKSRHSQQSVLITERDICAAF